MEKHSHSNVDQRTQKLREFHRKVKLILNDNDRDHLYSSLKKYQAERKLDKLLHSLKTILDTPVKLDLLKEIRGFIPPHQVGKYDEEVPYHNMAHKWKSRSMMNLNGDPSQRGYRGHSLPNSAHGTPVSLRRHGGAGVFQSVEGPVVKMLTVSLMPGERLGFCVRGGSEHGLGIFVSEVEEDSAAERCGLLIGDQIIEVNSIGFDNIAGSSAIKVLTGSERLKVMVRRVGKIPGFKSTREKIAWYDVHQRRLVRGDPAANNAMQLPGSLGLGVGHERKINLNKPTKHRPHLGFNIRGGAEFGLGIYVSRTDPGGLADENGLRVGEELLEVNGLGVRDRTHAQTVALIKAQKSLIITVRDVGRYPAFKEIYAEYKWVDVNTGRITKTKTSGHIQSVPIRSPIEDVFRQPFSESHITRLSDGEDSDGLEDVLKHLEPQSDPEAALLYGLALQEEKELHGDFIHQTPLGHRKSRLGNFSSLTRSLDNIPHHLQLDTVVPVSPLSKSSSEVDLSFSNYRPSSFDRTTNMSFATDEQTQRLYASKTKKKRQSVNLWDSDQTNTDDEGGSGERLFYKRPKSAMESAMEFSSIHDIHVASSHGNGSNGGHGRGAMFGESDDDESAVVPRRRSDVIMMQKSQSEGEESLNKTSSERSKSQHKSSLAVKALQNEARLSNPELLVKEEVTKVPDVHNHKDESRSSRSNEKDTAGSRSSSKSRSLRERLFGSRSKDRDTKDKNKSKKTRKPLSSINFDRDESGKGEKYEEIRQNAEGLLSPDETAAVLRHLNLYSDDKNLYGLTHRLFALLDSTRKMKLCSHIRKIVTWRDQKAFDSAVNDQFDSLERQEMKVKVQGHGVNASGRTSKVNSKPPLSSMSKENTTKVKVTSLKRVKRQAPPPPISPSSNYSTVTTSNLSDMSLSFTSMDSRNRLETSPESSHLTSSSSKSTEKIENSMGTNPEMSQRVTSLKSIKSEESNMETSQRGLHVSSSFKARERNGEDVESSLEISHLSKKSFVETSHSSSRSGSSKSKSEKSLSIETSSDVSHEVPLSKVDVIPSKVEALDNIFVLSHEVLPSKAQTPPPPPPAPPLPVNAGPIFGMSKSSTSSDAESQSTESGATMVKVDVHQYPDTVVRKPLEEGSYGAVLHSRETVNVRKYASESNLSMSDTNGDAGNNFKELANQKLEAFKQRSYNGSKNSLSSMSDHDIGNTRNNLMSELEQQLKKKRLSLDEENNKPDDMAKPGKSSTVFSSVPSPALSQRGTGGLVELNYMHSDSLFPALSHPNPLTSSSSTIMSDRSRVTEASQSESVLQATNALAFLDNMDTDSQFELSSISHVVTPRSEVSHLLTSRSDISASSAATSRFGSYDVNPDVSMSASVLSSLTGGGSLKRTPPRFIAPPPPVEPPPSEDENDDGVAGSVLNSSASEMASLRSYRKMNSDGDIILHQSNNQNNTEKHNSHTSAASKVTNGYHFDSRTNAYGTLEKNSPKPNNGYPQKRIGQKDTKLEHKKSETSKEAQTTSWLFKNQNITVKPKDSSTLGPSSGEKLKQEPLALDLSGLEDGEKKETTMVYLDKSFKTMGLSISGGTDSKVQPEIKVKSVFPGGAAEQEGTLKSGMQIVAVDNTSLVNVTHMRAVVTIKKSFENKSRPLMAMEIKV